MSPCVRLPQLLCFCLRRLKLTSAFGPTSPVWAPLHFVGSTTDELAHCEVNQELIQWPSCVQLIRAHVRYLSR